MISRRERITTHACARFAVALIATVLSIGSNAAAPSLAAESAGGRTLLSVLPSPVQMMSERTVDGRNFIQDMADAAANLKSYSFEYQTLVFKGKKQIDQEGSFYFRSPRLIRVEMTGNYKHGAVAVLGADGKVRGHLGGALGAITVTLSPDSDMLLGANGYPLVDSDFAGMSNVVKKFLAQGCKSKVTQNPVAVEGQQKKMYVLEIYKPNGTDLYKRAYIDPQTLLPVVWFDYNDGQLFARTIWKNFKNEIAIKDDVFKI